MKFETLSKANDLLQKRNYVIKLIEDLNNKGVTIGDRRDIIYDDVYERLMTGLNNEFKNILFDIEKEINEI